MIGQITVDASFFGSKFLPYIQTWKRYEIYIGSRNSLKSSTVVKKLILRSLEPRYMRLIYSRKTQNNIRTSQFQLFKDVINMWGLQNEFKIMEGSMNIVCIKTGNLFIPKGMDDPEKIKSTTEPSHIWCEEFSEYKLDDFEALDNSMRTKKVPTTFIGTMNPISHKLWHKKYFFDDKEKNFKDDILLHKSTYLDNPFIDVEEYTKKMERLSPTKQKFNRYGEWGEGLEGLIYPEYKTFDLPPDYANEEIYGIDFGYSNSKCAIVRVDASRNREEAFCTELCYRTGMLTKDVIDVLKKNNVRRQPVYCDSAEPDKIQELVNAGFNAMKSNKDIEAGIDFVKSWKIFVNSRSENMIMELDNYTWAKNKDGGIENFPEKGDDHLMDAKRYPIFSHFSKRKLIARAFR